MKSIQEKVLEDEIGMCYFCIFNKDDICVRTLKKCPYMKLIKKREALVREDLKKKVGELLLNLEKESMECQHGEHLEPNPECPLCRERDLKWEGINSVLALLDDSKKEALEDLV